MKAIEKKITFWLFLILCAFLYSCNHQGCDESSSNPFKKSNSQSISRTEYNEAATIDDLKDQFCQTSVDNTYQGKTLKVVGWYGGENDPYLYADINRTRKCIAIILPLNNDTIMQKIADSAASFTCYITGIPSYSCIDGEMDNGCEGPTIHASNVRLTIENSTQIIFKPKEQ